MHIVLVVRGAQVRSNQSESRCISLKRLSTNQIAGFAHLHKQNGRRIALCIANEVKGSRDLGLGVT